MCQNCFIKQTNLITRLFSLELQLVVLALRVLEFKDLRLLILIIISRNKGLSIFGSVIIRSIFSQEQLQEMTINDSQTYQNVVPNEADNPFSIFHKHCDAY